jgi:hypothetical protein
VWCCCMHQRCFQEMHWLLCTTFYMHLAAANVCILAATLVRSQQGRDGCIFRFVSSSGMGIAQHGSQTWATAASPPFAPSRTQAALSKPMLRHDAHCVHC